MELTKNLLIGNTYFQDIVCDVLEVPANLGSIIVQNVKAKTIKIGKNSSLVARNIICKNILAEHSVICTGDLIADDVHVFHDVLVCGNIYVRNILGEQSVSCYGVIRAIRNVSGKIVTAEKIICHSCFAQKIVTDNDNYTYCVKYEGELWTTIAKLNFVQKIKNKWIIYHKLFSLLWLSFK